MDRTLADLVARALRRLLFRNVTQNRDTLVLRRDGPCEFVQGRQPQPADLD